MNIRAEGNFKGRRPNEVPFLTHPSEPVDMYSEYLSKGPPPADESSNPRNLFDDSNKLDRKWFKSAQNHLNGLS